MEETVENWQEYSEQANKLHQILHAAEELLPSDEVEKLATADLDNQLQQAKVNSKNVSL